jgi:hypothetical protein
LRNPQSRIKKRRREMALKHLKWAKIKSKKSKLNLPRESSWTNKVPSESTKKLKQAELLKHASWNSEILVKCAKFA